MADSDMSPDLLRLLQSARGLCEPSERETQKITSTAVLAMDLVREKAKQYGEIAGIEFGGSFAKGTWLHGAADVDVFVKIDHAVPVEKFEEMGKSIGLAALATHHPLLRYSDHPYVEGTINGVRVNVVPCYNVEKGRWQSAADRSIFHTKYINDHYDAEMRLQARLLKKFLKSLGIYGAEISTAGFSGYVCEVLVLKFGSFQQVLQAMAAASIRQVVAIEGYDSDVVKGFPGPLVIIDPVDPRRNLGTAISPENVAKFVIASRTFLEKPSMEFFSGGHVGRVPKELYPSILVVEFSHPARPPDVIWGQLRRGTNAIAKQLEIAGFAVVRSECITDEKKAGAFAFLLESLTLPRYIRRKGPEVFRASDSGKYVEGFDSSPPSMLLWADREMRLAVLAKRKTTDARAMVRSILKNPEANGVPRELLLGIKLRIYSGGEKKFSKLVQRAVERLAATDRLLFFGQRSARSKRT